MLSLISPFCDDASLAIQSFRHDSLPALMHRKPCPGYEVLWHDLDEAALRAWRDLREAVLPTALQVKAKAEALKVRVEERAQLSADGAVILDDGEDEEDRESVEDAAGMMDEHAEDGEEEDMSEDAEEEERTTHHAREEEMSDAPEKMEEENAEDSDEQEEPEERRHEKIEQVTPHGAEASEMQSNHEEEGPEFEHMDMRSQGLEEQSDKGMKRKREDEASGPHAVRKTPTPLLNLPEAQGLLRWSCCHFL